MLTNNQFPAWSKPLLIVLTFIALFYNYGYMPLINDEGIRGLVAFEMMESGNYLTPTIGGDLYFKKPPLFNWLIALSFKAFGTANEWSLRLPSLLFLLIYTFTIYRWVKKELNENTAIMATLMFITNVRVLLYESLLGLIDITFSWVIFMLFISIYHFGKKQKWTFLFLSVYGFGVIGYFLKGLPAPVFIGFSLLAYFIVNKKFKILFHWAHFLGFTLFFSILFAYYYAYTQINNVSFDTIFSVVLNESSRRTASGHGVGKMILHLFEFPFQLLFHFLPWSLLILLWFKKGFIDTVRKSTYLSFIAVIFMANIWVYWVSPEFYPRYILMLVPFIFIFLAHFYLTSESKWKTYLDKFFTFFIALSAVIPFVPLFIPLIENNGLTILKCTGVFVLIAGLHYLFWKKKLNVLPAFLILFLIVRITFDAFVLPHRNIHERSNLRKQNIIKVVNKYPNVKFYSYYPTPTADGYYGRRNATYDIMFFISSISGHMYEISSEVKKGEYYLIQEGHFNPEKFNKIEDVRISPAKHVGYGEFYTVATGK